MAKTNKVDLTLLKKLVGELEISLQAAEEEKVDQDHNEYVVEMSKAAGLAAGVMQESSLLIMDIHGLIYGSTTNASTKNDLLDKILGPLKGGGTTN